MKKNGWIDIGWWREKKEKILLKLKCLVVVVVFMFIHKPIGH